MVLVTCPGPLPGTEPGAGDLGSLASGAGLRSLGKSSHRLDPEFFDRMKFT